MRLAIAYENGEVFQHFGETPSYLLIDIEGNSPVKKEIHDNGGASHIALIDVLSSLGVNALIVGGLGGGAFVRLQEAGIKVYAPYVGSADQALEDYLGGKLIEALAPTHQCSCQH